MKKTVSLFLSIVFAFMSLSPVCYAHDSSVPLSEEEQYLSEFTRIMANYQNDKERTLAALQEIDTVLLCEPICVSHERTGMFLSTAPSDYDLRIIAARRTNSPIVHIVWILTLNSFELFPGPLDYIGVEWDTAHAAYYSSHGDGNVSTVAGRTTGLVMFNIEDNKMNSGTQYTGAVYVRPSEYGDLEFGVKYTHTFLTSSRSGTSSYQFGNSADLAADGDFSLGLSYTYNYSTNVSYSVQKWSLWADNAITINWGVSE